MGPGAPPRGPFNLFKQRFPGAIGTQAMYLGEDAGPAPTRAAVVGALKKIDDWNGNGMFPPAGPASKRPATCCIIEKVVNGKFERWESPQPGFRCNDGGFFFRK